MSVTLQCSKHPRYKAVRAPRTDACKACCKACYLLYDLTTGYGIRRLESEVNTEAKPLRCIHDNCLRPPRFARAGSNYCQPCWDRIMRPNKCECEKVGVWP
jgi:hypothetical protein